ncbi:energy transducer TonB [Tenacibaculum sp. MEBiC06402]|uniref:energy transducer TonB n=1 Tax=unclassified Tenacibaculum TaxID=2635139 RepID=UPI003B9962A2
MKNLSPLLLIIFMLLSSTVFSQNKNQCETPNNETLLDLNTISRCTIEKSDDNTNKVSLKVAAKKTRKRIVRKRSKVNSIKSNAKNINSKVTKSTLVIKNEILTKTLNTEVVLFNVVEKVPSFPECKNENNIDCFNNFFSKHFAKTFDPERASEDGVTGRVFIQFTIDIQGNVNDLLIKTRKKDSLLEAEIRRVINKLPRFIPGKHKGIPVNVKYSLPINFSTE